MAENLQLQFSKEVMIDHINSPDTHPGPKFRILSDNPAAAHFQMVTTSPFCVIFIVLFNEQEAVFVKQVGTSLHGMSNPDLPTLA